MNITLPECLGHYLSRLAPTPLVSVRLSADSPVIWCKLEFLNPSGSTKDRIARFILERAFRKGMLAQGHTVVEASSGSTSIAMALTCAQMGLHFVAVMPEGVSNERVLMIRAFGGEVRFSPRALGIRGALDEAERIAQDPRFFWPRQFKNNENALAHRMGTAREIIDQIPGGAVDAVVSGVGTGGTLVGLYEGCRDAGCSITPVLARPVHFSMSPDVECCSFSACIPGVVDSVSEIFSPERLEGLETIEVPDDEAFETTRQLIRAGFPVGPSSGLNYRAAELFARRLGRAARVVTVMPDRMERYFTTELFGPLR